MFDYFHSREGDRRPTLAELLQRSPKAFFAETGSPLLDALLRARSDDAMLIAGSDRNDIMEMNPEEARAILIASPADQGDVLARVAVGLHLCKPVPHLSSHDFRRCGFDGERLFCLGRVIARQGSAAMTSADAAVVLDVICAPDGGYAREQHFDGDEDALGLCPAWEAESFTWWPNAVLDAVERNGEDEHAPAFRDLLDRLAAKWDRWGEDNGGLIHVLRRRIADLRGERVEGVPLPWYRAGDACEAKGSAFRSKVREIVSEHQELASFFCNLRATRTDRTRLHPCPEGFRDINYQSCFYRYLSRKSFEPALRNIVRRLLKENDTTLRGLAIVAIHRLEALLDAEFQTRPNVERVQIPEIDAIEFLHLESWWICKQSASFTPEGAVAVLKCKPRVDQVTLFHNIARAIGPETPGAHGAVEALIAAHPSSVLNGREHRKSIEALKSALVDPNDRSADDAGTLRQRLDATVSALTRFLPSDEGGHERWREAVRTALSTERFADIVGRVDPMIYRATLSITVEEASYWIYSFATEQDGCPLAGRLNAQVLSLAKLGVDASAAFATVNAYDVAVRENCRLFQYGNEWLERYRVPQQVDACRRRIAFYLGADATIRATFTKLEAFAAEAPTGTKPSAAWRKKARALLSAEERALAVDHLDAFLASTDPGLPDRSVTDYEEAADRPLAGIVWMAADWPAERVAPVLAAYARRCYAAEPGRGIKAEKIGNACLWSLQALPNGAGTPYLARLSTRVKYPKIKKKIDAALNAAAEAAGTTRADLDELIVPDHGFRDGVRRFDTPHGAAVLTLDARGRVALAWRDAAGKTVKAPPKAMKAQAADTVKAAKALHKEAEADLKAQFARIERLSLDDRAVPAEAFAARYLDHPLIGPACRALIWRVGTTPALWQDGRLADVAGNPVALDAPVRLWHPIEDVPEAALAWRDRLEALDLVQPLKQAWREVYVVTDAERATGHYSNRFAGHIVRQHQTMTLARLNGWRATHRMAVDAPNDEPMWTAFPAHDVYVEYWTAAPDYDSPMLDSGAFVHLHTDRVAFHRLAGDPASAGPGWVRGERLSVDDVPPVVFSEVMRHADLMVAVASIAADPAWRDRGAGAAHPSSWERDALAYYDHATSGALTGSGTVRREALARLLPRLKIADRVTLGERHVEVRGIKRSYRIHIGSGAVHRGPDGRHVCIVPDRAATRADVRLPFEGDGTLSLVLSKAIMLADDDKITDPVILAQI